MTLEMGRAHPGRRQKTASSFRTQVGRVDATPARGKVHRPHLIGLLRATPREPSDSERRTDVGCFHTFDAVQAPLGSLRRVVGLAQYLFRRVHNTPVELILRGNELLGKFGDGVKPWELWGIDDEAVKITR